MQRRRLLQAALAAMLPGTLRAAGRLRAAVFPDYHVPEVLDAFTVSTGITIELIPFDSNEALLAACLRGEPFDLMLVSHYLLPHLRALQLIQPLPDSLLAQLQPTHWRQPFADFCKLDDEWFAVPKNFGTTGFLYRRSRLPELNGWVDFFAALPRVSRHASFLDDSQSVVGAALCAAGYTATSTTPRELLAASLLLQQNRRHVRSLNNEALDVLQAGDRLAMSFSDSGFSATESNEDIAFVHPADGGELWCDYYVIARQTARLDAVVALLVWLLAPAQIAREVIELGVSPVDNRVMPLLSASLQQHPIVFPSREVLSRLQFVSQNALRDPLRARLFNEFASQF